MPALWVETSRPPTVPGTDAHAVCLTPILFLILHLSWFTFGLVVVMAIVVAVLTIQGRSVGWLLNKGRCKLRGARVSARPLFYRRRMLLVESYGGCAMSVFRKVES